MDILIGADPEIFVKKKDTGELVSAYGLIPGTKKEPFKVDFGAVQVDGMALEFNIDPAASFQEFIFNITAVMNQLKEMVGPEYEFAIQPTAHFGKDYIEAQPDVAKELGCEPDFNAYTKEANPRPDGSQPFRTASGHIHIGWTKDMDPHDPEHFEACCMLTKQLDYVLGLSSLLWDNDTERRLLYGNLGAFRPKSYGVEYRVLSNAWLTDERLMQEVFNLTKTATNELVNGNDYGNRSDRTIRDFKNGNLDHAWDVFAAWAHGDNWDYFRDLYSKRFNEKAVRKPTKSKYDFGLAQPVVQWAVGGDLIDLEVQPAAPVLAQLLAPPVPPLHPGIEAAELGRMRAILDAAPVPRRRPRAGARF